MSVDVIEERKGNWPVFIYCLGNRGFLWIRVQKIGKQTMNPPTPVT